MRIKASELKQGDVIRAERWSHLWKRMTPTACTVMSVQECPGGNLLVHAKAQDGFKQFLTDIFTPAAAEFAVA